MDYASSLYPPIQRDVANQQPLLIVYKQSIVRPAAFKNRPAAIDDQNRAESQQQQLPLKLQQDFPSKIISRMNPIRRKESVCRSLFGPVDREQLRRDLTQRMKEIAEQDSRRWNFNFQTETPLPGRFQWEEIPADCAAAVYQEPAQVKDHICSPHTAEQEEEDRLSQREESAGADQENCSSISNTHKRPAEVTPVRRKRSLSKPAAKPRSNARITDFFAKRKRTTETKTILNPFHTSSSEAALCKTIR